MNSVIRRARRPVPADPLELVTFEPLSPGAALPLLCRPRLSGVRLPEWGRLCREQIEHRLHAHGALLFRGFDVADVGEFSACVDAISGGCVAYMFRASPRTQVDTRFNVYTSTDYPAAERIFPHNEHSYSPVFPLELYFYCDVPAQRGGETPVGATREIFRRIRAEVSDSLRQRGVMYVRNYGDGMGLPWQTVFQTEDRAQVEAYCRSVGISAEWKSGGRLRTRQVGPAVVRHPRTGELAWFNHATFFNALTLPERAQAELLAQFSAQDLPQNTFYGDGAPIEPDVVRHLQDAYRASMVEFAWEKGDVLLLDNLLAVHARNPFSGPRRVLTGMAKATNSADLAPTTHEC
jgi:alpha-ketoglutarate-dependent taurine dioxygenase